MKRTRTNKPANQEVAQPVEVPSKTRKEKEPEEPIIPEDKDNSKEKVIYPNFFFYFHFLTLTFHRTPGIVLRSIRFNNCKT